jgi:hypothetical protein
MRHPSDALSCTTFFDNALAAQPPRPCTTSLAPTKAMLTALWLSICATPATLCPHTPTRWRRCATVIIRAPFLLSFLSFFVFLEATRTWRSIVRGGILSPRRHELLVAGTALTTIDIRHNLDRRCVPWLFCYYFEVSIARFFSYLMVLHTDNLLGTETASCVGKFSTMAISLFMLDSNSLRDRGILGKLCQAFQCLA